MRYAWIAATVLVGAVGLGWADWLAGTQALHGGDAALAAQEFAQVLEEAPFDARVYYMLAISLEKLDRTELSRSCLGRAFALDQGENPTIALEYARVLLESEAAADAVDILGSLDRKVLNDQEQTRYALLFAQAMNHNGTPGKAVACLQFEIGAHPGDARLHQALGVALDHQGEEDQARAAFAKAFALDSSCAECGRSAVFATLSLAQKESSPIARHAHYERTAVLAQQLAELTGDQTYTLLAAETWIEAEQPAKALPWLEQARTRKPGSAMVWYLWARYNQLCGDQQQTQEALRQALKTGVRGELRRKVYDLLGDVYVEQGDVLRAASAYKEAHNLEKIAGLKTERQLPN